MQSVAVLSHKGGTGKTTVATHLSVCAHAAGHRSVLMDMDPQRSAIAWGRLRSAPGPAINEARAGTFYFARQSAEKQRADLMVVDTAPNCEADTLEAVRWADLCLIVLRPSFFDIQAVARTIEAVKALGRPGMILFNQSPLDRGRAVRSASEALIDSGLPICEAWLGSRPAFQEVTGQGLTVGEFPEGKQAAAEVAAVWRALESRLNLAGDTVLARAS